MNLHYPFTSTSVSNEIINPALSIMDILVLYKVYLLMKKYVSVKISEFDKYVSKSSVSGL